MCAGASGKIKNKDVSVYMGYYGGSITVDNGTYGVGSNESGSREEVMEVLMKHKKADIINLFLDLVQDSNE